jgi:cyanophycinase
MAMSIHTSPGKIGVPWRGHGSKKGATNDGLDGEKRKQRFDLVPRYLIPIGGNEKKSPDSEIFQHMVHLAGGSSARIIVVPTASESPGERARDYEDLFSRFDPLSIHTVHIGNRRDAGSKNLVQLINETTLFMFAGGDQLRLSSLIGGTPLHQALLERYRAGGCVVAGTSAGAAALPEVMIFQSSGFRLFRKGGIEMTKGFGLIQDTILDTHFVTRSRISRLVHAVATNPALLGLGIEENTGLLIEDETTATVIGTGTVIVVDGRAIQVNHIGFADNRHPFALTNVIYSILTPGMVYDLVLRTVLDPGPIAPPESVVPGPTRRSSKARNK